MDVITGFTVGTDKISLLTATSAAVAKPATLTYAADIVTSDNLTASLVVIEAGTAQGTYLYVNDADASFSANADVFIKLVGVIPAVGELAITSPKTLASPPSLR